MMQVRLTKAKIRSKILFELKTQKEEDRERKSREILEKLLRTKEFKKAKGVMFYVALDGEVNTQEMIKAAEKLGKIIAVPVCKKNRMSLEPCLLDEHANLIKGPYGVREPVLKKCLRINDLDLVIVPGLAFTKNGKRLGRGKGFYDRFLKRIPPKTHSIGLAFVFQILPSLPTTPRDVNVQKVLFA